MSIEKRLILVINHITGETHWENPDDMNVFEVLGLMEVTKLQMLSSFINSETK